jgi:bifunctional non-homologous end joining protein LigD
VAVLPTTLAPMKATSSEHLPVPADQWDYEVKWDGMRALVFVDDGTLRVQSSNLLDVTAGWPELDGLPAALGVGSAILDGELVATDERGVPSFGRLQQRMHVGSAAEARGGGEVPVSYVVFDLLHLDGHDLTPLPLAERRRFLGEVVEPAPSWRCSPVYDDGATLLDAARERGLEGVMAKRPESAYEPGKRSRNWRKVKVRRRQELVVGGWLPGEGGRAGRIGALLVGVHEAPGGALRYAGRVGTGFAAAELDRLGALLAPLELDRSPFDPPPPRPVSRLARWVRPELVAEVAFGEWTAEGLLRHPSYLGLRADVVPTTVVREPG